MNLPIDPTDTGGTDENTIRFTFFGNLGVSCNDLDLCFICCSCHGNQDFSKFTEGKTLFEDKGGSEKLGYRTKHGNIVDGSANCQSTDISASKEERGDNVSISRNDQVSTFGNILPHF